MAIQIRARLRAELRQTYLGLRFRPGPRWHTQDGQAFLHDLDGHVERYGQRQIASALGVTPQAVSQMLKRHDPTQLFALPRTSRALRDLKWSHRHIRAWRDLGRNVRRNYESYRRVHDALEELMVIHSVSTVAKMSGIPAKELHRFTEPPQETTFDDVALWLLIEDFDNGRALTGPRRRAFLTQLEETLASHELVEVARLLHVSPRVMRTWMVEKSHGQRPEEDADPRT